MQELHAEEQGMDLQALLERTHMDMEKAISAAKEKAIEKAPDLEPWSDYYRLRAKEMEVLAALHAIENVGAALEIGCGNGFVSAILSHCSDEVISTDLSRPDTRTHSLGISRAQEFFRRLGITNCTPVSCSGERLPFRSRTFDLVFCAHTLEHIPCKDGALRDVRRVMKDDAEAIFIVPTLIERMCYPAAYYHDLFMRALRLFRPRRSRSVRPGPAAAKEGLGERGSLWKRFRAAYPHFPIPEPHGSYGNFFQELVNYRTGRWLGFFKANGFHVVSIFSTMLIPRHLLLFFTEPLTFYERFSWIDKRFGARRGFRILGQNICIVAKKSSGHAGII